MSDKTQITYYKNCCPFCKSDDLLMQTVEDEEAMLYCNKCKKSFPVNSAVKKKVGDTTEIK
jgi:hypothetical protein